MVPGMMEPVEEVLQIGRHRVELSHLDRVLFPDTGLTKGDLVSYYQRIAGTMLPHLRQRPISMERRPGGLEGRGFYQKQAPEHFPDWIQHQTIELRQGGSREHLVCDDAATLVFLANRGTITPHVWQSRIDGLERPDRLVLDLDPAGDDFTPVRHAARLVAGVLEDLGLAPYAMLTGSRGVHLVAPLRREQSFDEVRQLARDLARWLARRHPGQLTVARRKAERGDRLFLDTARNAYGQTTVAPYAVRALPGAPVATPIDPGELSSSTLSSRRYNIRNIFRRLAHKADPWLNIGHDARSFRPARARLDQIVGRQGNVDS